MTPDEILRCKAKILTQEQREHYFSHGFILVKNVIDNRLLRDLLKVTNQFIEASKGINAVSYTHLTLPTILLV